MHRLRGTVAVVTGASRGGGRGISLVQGEEGATVYVWTECSGSVDKARNRWPTGARKWISDWSSFGEYRACTRTMDPHAGNSS